VWYPPLRRRLIYSDLQDAREEERRREGRGEEQRVDKLGNYSSITGFATIRQVGGGGAEGGPERDHTVRGQFNVWHLPKY
jgi:hypothetical protein